MRLLLSCLVLTAALAAGLPACAQTSHNQLTDAERAEGWRLLFDGRTTAGWRGYQREAVSGGWKVIDGTLTRASEAGDIITEAQFGSFELSLEWRIAPGGNSGIFFHVVEDPALQYVWESGPELQILDDAAHRDGLKPETSSGSNYALHARTEDVAHPVGEWNQARIVVRGDHVEHWLNGVRIVAYELGSEDWQERVRASKFKDMPRYGAARRGHIALQDHGDRVSFRNIKVRELP
ncbi:MAG TPA: DUF1080 domain-containing protein [Longimicrobiales bacterium]|nr:DUF1080 domain-containing protein [Longimicrobiales bacterium]